MWLTNTYAHSFARNWQMAFLNQWKRQNDHRKNLIIILRQRMLPNSDGDWTHDLLIISWTHMQLSQWGWQTVLWSPALINCSLETPKRVIGKQCRPRSDATECNVCSGSPLFANSSSIFLQEYLNHDIPKINIRSFQYIVWWVHLIYQYNG